MKKDIRVIIDFKKILTHADLLSTMIPFQSLEEGDFLDLNIDLNSNGLIYPDFLLLVAVKIDYLRKKGVGVQSSLINFNPYSSQANYASRINFFEMLGIGIEEEFIRRDSQGRFIEICEFDQENIYEIFGEIMRILLVNGVNEDMLVVLHFCLNEILDNTLNHASPDFVYGAGTGYVIAQFFPVAREIRIMIADTGQGIHSALTGHPKSRFKDLSEQEAVLRCIERGVTNSLGLGFGLWATSQMMLKNQGEFKIFSGKSCLNNSRLEEVPHWQGTINYLKINTNIPVDHKEIFGEKSDQLDMFQEFKESQFGDLENLW